MQPALLVDGRVAGTWTHEVRDGVATLVVTPLAHVAQPPADLEEEALRVLAMVAPEASEHRLEWLAGD